MKTELFGIFPSNWGTHPRRLGEPRKSTSGTVAGTEQNVAEAREGSQEAPGHRPVPIVRK